MAATTEIPEVERALSDRYCATDAARHAAHISHEARLVKSLVTDAVEDGVHAAKRAMKSVGRRVEELGDLKDEAAYRVKRQPIKAIGVAAGIGLVVGVTIGWIGARLGNGTASTR